MTKGKEPITAIPSSSMTAYGLGLTKREYFAAMAMQGHISACGIEGVVVDVLARYAVECANALINELNK